jgi:hypothetical protein
MSQQPIPRENPHQIGLKNKFVSSSKRANSEVKVREREKNLENKICSHKAIKTGTSKTQEHHESMRNSSIQKPKGSYVHPTQIYKQKGGERRNQRGNQEHPRKSNLMTLKPTLEGSQPTLLNT